MEQSNFIGKSPLTSRGKIYIYLFAFHEETKDTVTFLSVGKWALGILLKPLWEPLLPYSVVCWPQLTESPYR